MRTVLLGALALAAAMIGWLTRPRKQRRPGTSHTRPVPYSHGQDEELTLRLWREELDALPTAKAADVWPGGTPPWMLEEWRS